MRPLDHADLIAERVRALKLVIFDFDGVFTDNLVYVLEDGREAVRCSRAEGLGLRRLEQLDIEAVILSTEVNAVVGARGAKLKIQVLQGCEDKLASLKALLESRRLDPSQVAFVGNDLNDLDCLRWVGLPIVVHDAHADVLDVAIYRTKRRGGNGAVREVCDLVASVLEGAAGRGPSAAGGRAEAATRAGTDRQAPEARVGGNPFGLNGRVVVVTGGAGLLGRNFTEALLRAGARVCVVDLVPVAERDGLLSLVADVTDRNSLQAALEKILAEHGVPDGLINAAALDFPPDASAAENGPFETLTTESWDRVMDANVKGIFLCCQVFGGAMAAAGRGSIVNIGSIYGMVSPDQGLYQHRRDRGEEFYKPITYSVSKSALYNLTRYLACYWGNRNVRVNIVSFGGVSNNQDPEFMSRYNAKVPLGRMAKPEEYGGVVQFLLSEAASYITGSNLVVDGGFTAL